jgi:hypothetical protein
MPVHDWTRVDAGLFHFFQQHWNISLCDSLNGGGLPPGFFALAEQAVRGPVPDVLALRLGASKDDSVGVENFSGLAVVDSPPRARMVRSTERNVYPKKADRLTVRHRHGRIVAVIEVVSPGNKGSRSELRAFVMKMADLLQQGVHALVIDLFPPTKRDPQGIQKAIWDEFEEEDDELPPDQPLTVGAYSAGLIKTTYVEPFAVGDDLPSMPLFLETEIYIPVALEATYRTSWGVFPAALKGLLESSDATEGQPAP